MSYVDAAIARLKDDAERNAATPPTREVGPWTYKRIPEKHGYLLDTSGVIPPEVMKTIGECEYQHEAAMNVIAALLASHAALAAECDALREVDTAMEDAILSLRAERDALRKDAARLDYMETLREPWSRRPMRAVTGSEWSIVHAHPLDYTPTLREALDAALAVQP